ncbi:MAG: hypothetical protein QGF59_19525, partial [Pirellulaceae bacterium]|nr:hypothetical protein [Pirellulaceae bacterium]
MPSKATSNQSRERRRWKMAPIEERIVLANKLLVLHPRFREAVNVLKRCHESRGRGGEPLCGAILGAS